MNRFLLIISAIAGFSVAPAHAVVFQFDGTASGAAIDAPTNVGNITTDCGTIGRDFCTLNNAEGFQFASGGVSFTATAFSGGTLTGDTFDRGTPELLIQDLVGINQGLGVIATLEGDPINNSNDQINHSTGESVLFTFLEEVSISNIFVNDGIGNDCPGGGREGPCGDIGIIVDGGFVQTIDDFLTFGVLGDGIGNVLNLVGTTFEFISLSDNAGFSIEAITISTPIPGAIPLLLSGIAGLSFAARGRKTRKS